MATNSLNRPVAPATRLAELAAAVPFWYHSIDLGGGVVTPGCRPARSLERALDDLALPDLAGKSVLDVNTFDGFFAFACEARGAARVTALDHYMWAMDLAEHRGYLKWCSTAGVTPAPYHTMPYYQPDRLPGKAGFDLAHRALGSRAEVVVADFMEMDLDPLGVFDVVLFLGSLYHMEDPLRALRRLRRVTREVAIIESEAVELRGQEDRPLFEFFAGGELYGDVSNWWAPNECALVAACRAAGFREVRVIVGSPLRSAHSSPGSRGRRGAVHALLSRLWAGWRRQASGAVRYRAIVHALP